MSRRFASLRAASPQSSRINKAVLASAAMSVGYRPSPLAIGSAWSRRGNRTYRTVEPSRQA